ncbi:MAG TPA: M20/M25/M40 family metallo-hydrolase [Bacteroidales bacterium]|nr:M20/M25/M40 family metallo-hydrolase [Bacteroidales bacterium]
MRKFFKALLVFLFLYISSVSLFSQETDKIISSFFDEALTDRTAYGHLKYLCKQTGGRICGSDAAAKAVRYTMQALRDAGADTVWLQEVQVPHWVRGTEKCTIISKKQKSTDLSVATLGLSVPTPMNGLTAGVIEVKNIQDLQTKDRKQIEGKIVFFNNKVDNRLVNTFTGYSGAVRERTMGAAEASKYGAVAVIVRSVTQSLDDFPHTGVTSYDDGTDKIPAVAVSTLGAESLSNYIKNDPDLRIRLLTKCKRYNDTISYNVIGEIRGSEKPHEIITAGGHLDSWDITEGAHDDAGGCVQAIEMIRMYKKLGIRPKRTIRAVMFMNEEMSGTGGRKYAQSGEGNGDVHYAALESDRGVMSPRGFSFDAEGKRLQDLQSLQKWFNPYNISEFEKGGGGSDINPLKAKGALLIGYLPDPQRYFSYHHSANDTFDQVNIRELQMGSAAIASLIYLIDMSDL